MLVTTDIKSITYEIEPQKKVQNYGIYFQNHFRNFCELSGSVEQFTKQHTRN